MNKILPLIIALLLSSLISVGAKEVPAEATVVYLVRHTEKDLTIKKDPPLTDQGKLRAKKWAEVLSDVSIDEIYSTDTLRTRDTAGPSAELFSKQVKLYHPYEINMGDLVEENKGKNILVVGHSNTVPNMVNHLLETKQSTDVADNKSSSSDNDTKEYEELDESEYNKLFIVTILGEQRHVQVLTVNPF